jgi:DNA-binding transcriptional ArsR family regulator
MPHVDRLSATFSALADPTRRAILARLARGEATVGELGKPFDISAPAISKHLRVLERAGLISRGRDAQWRPCQLRATPLRAAAGWIDDYRQFWTESFDRLTDYLLLETQPTPKKGPRHAAAKRKRR